jgi:hypothetical protein
VLLLITLTAVAMKKTTIGDTDNLPIASTSALIGLLPKIASFVILPIDCQWGVDTAVPYHGCILTPLRSVVIG